MNEEKEKDMTVSPSAVEKGHAIAPKKKGFVKALKDEMKKVSWTSKEELKTCTKIVLGSIFAFGFAIYGVDLFLRAALQGIATLSRLITG